MTGLARGPWGAVVNVIGVNGQLIAANSNRNGIIFVNCSTTITVYIVPGNLTAAVGAGIPLLPQSDYRLLPIAGFPIGVGGAFNAIADSGAANVLVMEFFSA